MAEFKRMKNTTYLFPLLLHYFNIIKVHPYFFLFYLQNIITVLSIEVLIDCKSIDIIQDFIQIKSVYPIKEWRPMQKVLTQIRRHRTQRLIRVSTVS